MRARAEMGRAELAFYASRGSLVAYRYWLAATGRCCEHPGNEVVRTPSRPGVSWYCVCRACGRSWQEFDVNDPAPYLLDARRSRPEQHAADWSAKIEPCGDRTWLVYYGWTLRAICNTRQQAREVMLALKGFDR